VHIPSATIADWDPATGAGLLGDKAISVVFDNSKIRRLVPDFVCTTPFARGVEESVAWIDADPERDALMDRMIASHEQSRRDAEGGRP